MFNTLITSIQTTREINQCLASSPESFWEKLSTSLSIKLYTTVTWKKGLSSMSPRQHNFVHSTFLFFFPLRNIRKKITGPSYFNTRHVLGCWARERYLILTLRRRFSWRSRQKEIARRHDDRIEDVRENF